MGLSLSCHESYMLQAKVLHRIYLDLNCHGNLVTVATECNVFYSFVSSSNELDFDIWIQQGLLYPLTKFQLY